MNKYFIVEIFSGE